MSSSGQGAPSSFGRRGNKTLPDKIRCDAGEIKSITEFSKNTITKFQSAYNQGHATPMKTGIRCRVHNEPLKELRCKGPCGRYRVLDQFSKSARSSGKLWCKDCTEWQLSNEPHDVPWTPPGVKLSDLEKMLLEKPKKEGGLLKDEEDVGQSERSGRDFGSSLAESSRDGTDNDGSEYGEAENPWVILGRTEDATDDDYDGGSYGNEWESGRGTGTGPTRRRWAPSTVAGGSSLGTVAGGQRGGNMDMASSVDTESVDFFMGPPMNRGSAETSHGGHASSALSGNSDTTTRGGQNRQPVVKFNAFGPEGQRTTIHKTPTVQDDERSTASATTSVVTVGASGWVKTSQRKTKPSAPSYIREELKYSEMASYHDSDGSDDAFTDEDDN